jgi:hypothetical protein
MLGIAALFAVLAAGDAAAAPMTKDEYKAGRKRCGAHVGNNTDICVAQARAAQKIATAELDAAYKPSPRAYHKAALARADADYDVAKQKCDAEPGGAKSACVKAATEARDSAKVEAKAAAQAR